MPAVQLESESEVGGQRCARRAESDAGGMKSGGKWNDRDTHPGSPHGGDKELGAVGVGTGVGHREEAWAVVAKLEVLVYGKALANQVSNIIIIR